jgi:hypothetical protein
VSLRAEKDRQKLNQALTQAANERLFPTKQELPTPKVFKAELAKRPKVLMSERRARSQAQYEKVNWPKDQ